MSQTMMKTRKGAIRGSRRQVVDVRVENQREEERKHCEKISYNDLDRDHDADTTGEDKIGDSRKRTCAANQQGTRT